MNKLDYSEALETLAVATGETRRYRGPNAEGGRAFVDERGHHYVLSDSHRNMIAGIGETTLIAAQLLPEAKPMFWARTASDLVFEVSKQIDFDTQTSPDLLYCANAWCWLESPREFIGRDDDDPSEPLLFSAISWNWGKFISDVDTDLKEGLFVVGWMKGPKLGLTYVPLCVAFVQKDMALSAYKCHEVSWGSRVHEALLKFVVAAGAFLRTKLSITDSRQAERHTRKRLAAKSWSESTEIEIVMLRERESREPVHGERFIEWQHQWIVRAHTRQQWYPSKGKNLPIIVAPYLKGPEGKPLKAPSSSVFAVTR